MRWSDAFIFRQFGDPRALNDDLAGAGFFGEGEIAAQRDACLDDDRIAIVRGVERCLQAVLWPNLDNALAVLNGLSERARALSDGNDDADADDGEDT